MKNCTLFLFSSIFVSSIAFGQQQHATIVVLADSSAGETMYLTRFRGPMLDYERVDSARVDANHRALFSVVPDPLMPYRIQSTTPSLENRIYLAGGDSLIFSYSASHDSLLFDRIGANRSFRDSMKPWEFDMKLVRENMSSMNWDRWHTYIESRKSWFDKKAEWYASKYPEHTGLRAMFVDEEIMQYYNSVASYLLMHYWDSTGKPVIDDPSCLRIMDSVPWTESPFSQSFEMCYASMFWVNIAWKRWQHDGIDTAGNEYGVEAFLLAQQLPPPVQDGAILYVVSNCTKRYSPIQGVPLLEREYEAYKPIASDTAYLAAFDKMLIAFRNKTSGKGRAPAFKLPDTANTIRSLSDFRGKVVYLDFWGTWCEPCRKELPSLLSLEKKFERDTNVAFVSIALQASEYEEERVGPWKKFIADKGLHGTQLFGENEFNNEAAEAYGIKAVPAFMLIDRNGNFIDAAAPRPSSGKAEDAIRAALSEP